MSVALLFDLDDTLVVEEGAAVASFAATAEHAAGPLGLDAEALARAGRRCARELWRSAPTHGYCARIGISSWEGLWCRFEGDGDHNHALRAWAPEYRREAWRLALAEQDVDDAELAAELGERFGAERRARHETFADAEPVLRELRSSHALALVTNGASCLQREKLAASGLGELFDAVVVSGDLGVGKPEAVIFAHALEAVGADRGVMVGDNLGRDVEGALAAGLDAVWLNRERRARPDHRRVVEVAGLGELPAMLRRSPPCA